MCVAVAVAGDCPYMPARSKAMTMLWVPMRPQAYALGSLGGLEKSRGLLCSSSSKAIAAACSMS